MKVLVLIALAIICIEAKPKWHQLEGYTFENYVKDFGKAYKDSEIEDRRTLFNKNVESIKSHNRDTTKTWKEGVNQFTDRTEEERKLVLGLNKGLLYAQKEARQKKMSPIEQSTVDANVKIPINVDWRNAGIITAVKDQGECGSCWTFGTAETIESYLALANPGNLVDLSEQQILDCVPNSNDCGGTGGCGGGTPELAYAGLMNQGGIATEWTYPYISYFSEAQSCQHATIYTKISGFNVLTPNSYSDVINHIANVGPLAVNVQANTWPNYESGVFNGCNQTDPDIDHVVQLVGYGTDPHGLGDYWLIRNSWSPDFGEDGYIRLARPANTPCGVDTSPADGTGCNGGPSSVTVCGTCGVLYDTSFPVMSTK